MCCFYKLVTSQAQLDGEEYLQCVPVAQKDYGAISHDGVGTIYRMREYGLLWTLEAEGWAGLTDEGLAYCERTFGPVQNAFVNLAAIEWQRQLADFRRNVVDKHHQEWKFYNGRWHKWNGGGYYPYVRDFIAYPVVQRLIIPQ